MSEVKTVLSNYFGFLIIDEEIYKNPDKSKYSQCQK